MNKIEVYHFHNGMGGGVLSVIKNLFKYKVNDCLENHLIYTINKDVDPCYLLPDVDGATTVQVFYYSGKWNFYYTCKQLAKLLPDDKAVIVAHDWLELGMVSNLGLQNPVVQVLHGEYNYYYDLALSHENGIDAFITVADLIKNKLREMLFHRKNEIEYLRFPVPDCKCVEEKSIHYSIVFIGRYTKAKGYHLLPEIADMVEVMNVKLQWHIVGEQDESLMKEFPWSNKIDIIFHGVLDNEAVHILLCEMHFFILPSAAEGMPVTLVEAMKAGVVPLVNDLPGGIQELIVNGETGFRVAGNSSELYAKHLCLLCAENSNIQQVKLNAIQIANNYFAPHENTEKYESVLLAVTKKKRHKLPRKIYGSRLDAPWLSNLVVKNIRKLISVK